MPQTATLHIKIEPTVAHSLKQIAWRGWFVVLVTGTIGILQASVRDRQLTMAAANDLLRKMNEEE